MKKKILLTRPRASSERWAAQLARHGFDCVIEPLLTIAPTHAPRPTGLFQAVMITSGNAIDALLEQKESCAALLPLPCYCVGLATGEAARTFGFTDIRCGTSDGAGLAQKIAAELTDKSRPVLHIAGDIVDGKAQDILAKSGFALVLWPVYQASAAEDFSPGIGAQFKAGEFAAIPLFSPRSARVLVSLIEKNRLTPACHGTVAIGLSQAVADVLQTLPWRRLCVAPLPTEEDVLACLQSELSMSEAESAPVSPAPPPSLAPAPKRKSKKRFGWVLLVIILAAAGAAAIWYDQLPEPSAARPNAPDIAELQKRVQILEAQLDTQNETAQAAPPEAASPPPTNSADIDALNLAVKNLQVQIAQMQDQTQKTVAAAFAFWDLREAAASGRAFATQLANLRAADPALDEQAARIEPYAAAGAPTFAQLHATLSEQETSLPPPAGAQEPPAWKERVKSILQNLVSVHPLHDPQFAALETALDSANAPAALDAFNALPAQTQTLLAGWKQKLDARAAVDETLHALSSHFTSPSPGGAP